MDIEKIATLAASLVGAFWIVLQIITHIHEKGHRNAVTALAIVLAGALPVTFFIYHQRHADPESGPTLFASPDRLRMAITAPSRPRAASLSPTPISSPPPAGTAASVPPYMVEATAAGSVPTDPSATFISVSPTGLGPSPSPHSPVADSPPSSPAGAFSAAFHVELSHNLVGGLSQVLLECTFSQTGQTPITLSGYTITVHVRAHGDTSSSDHVFDRVSDPAIQFQPGLPLRVSVPVDAELGDLLVAYRKQPSNAWIHINWKGVTAEGQPIQSGSDNNRQE